MRRVSHHHHGVGYAQHARRDVLHLGRILRGGDDRQLPLLAGDRERDLAFEVEVLLPTDRKLPFEAVRRGCQRSFRVAAAEGVVGLHLAPGRDRILDGEDRRLRFYLDDGAAHGAASGIAGPCHDREQGLAVEHDIVGGKHRLVAGRRRDVVAAGNIGGGEHGDDARRAAHGSRSSLHRRPRATFASPGAICSVPAGSRMSST